jgi:hypothetical protein
MSTNMERLTAAVGRRLKAITVRFRCPFTSYRGFYGLSIGQDDSSQGVNTLNKPDASASPAASSQAWLPIGPSCC